MDPRSAIGTERIPYSNVVAARIAVGMVEMSTEDWATDHEPTTPPLFVEWTTRNAIFILLRLDNQQSHSHVTNTASYL